MEKLIGKLNKRDSINFNVQISFIILLVSYDGLIFLLSRILFSVSQPRVMVGLFTIYSVIL